MSVQRTSDHDGTSTDATDGVTSIAKDDAFHVLQNARRRAVLRFLIEHDDEEKFRMRDVAEEVAAWEHDTTVQQLSSDERQRVYIALYQSHLPKLDEHGIIEYNQARGVVAPTPLLRAFEPYVGDTLHVEDEALSAAPGSSARADDERSFAAAVGTLLSR